MGATHRPKTTQGQAAVFNLGGGVTPCNKANAAEPISVGHRQIMHLLIDWLILFRDGYMSYMSY